MSPALQVIPAIMSARLVQPNEGINMSVISILLSVALFGFIAWMVCQIPMPDPVRKILVAVICVVLILWVLGLFGVHTGLPTVRMS